MRLTMLVPTRGRPQNALRLRDAIMATAVLSATTVAFGVDEDDPARARYESALWTNTVVLPASTRRGMVDTLNAMTDMALTWLPDDGVIGFMGDDHLPRTLGWDKALCDALEGKPAALAYGNDLLQGERIPTAVAMTASIPRTIGYMAPPQLAHLYVDNVWLDWGRALNAITHLPDIVIEHLHPAAGKADRDAGYDAVNALEVDSADRAAYLAYRDGGALAADIAKLRALT